MEHTLDTAQRLYRTRCGITLLREGMVMVEVPARPPAVAIRIRVGLDLRPPRAVDRAGLKSAITIIITFPNGYKEEEFGTALWREEDEDDEEGKGKESY